MADYADVNLITSRDGVWYSPTHYFNNDLSLTPVVGPTSNAYLYNPWSSSKARTRIVSAVITLQQVYRTGPGPYIFDICGAYEGDASLPANYQDAEGRPRTTSRIQWEMPNFAPGSTILSPDISSIIQEIICNRGYVDVDPTHLHGCPFLLFFENWSGDSNSAISYPHGNQTGNSGGQTSSLLYTYDVSSHYLLSNSTSISFAAVNHPASTSVQSHANVVARGGFSLKGAASPYAKSSISCTLRKLQLGSSSAKSSASVVANGIISSDNSSSDGALVGGSSSVTYSVVHCQGSGGVDVSGSSLLRLSIKSGTEGGGVTLGGDALVKTVYKFRSAGGVVLGSDPRSQSVSLVIVKSYEFIWRTNQAATATYDFAWSTGQQRSYFYRVVSKAKDDVCNPLLADGCCKKFVVNIQARNIDDVCRKLRDRIGVWPIEMIQRFSRPAERAAIAEDEATGIDHTCNKAEDVEFCKVPVCADFCVEYDLREAWGGYSILEYTGVSAMGVTMLSISRKHQHAASGGFTLGGAAKSRFTRELRFTPVLRAAKIGGAAVVRSTNYSHKAIGGLTVGGTAGRKAPRWKFQGGRWPAYAEVKPTIVSGWEQSPDGSFHCALGDGPGPMLMISGLEHEAPDERRLIGVIVEIDRYANGLVQDADVVMFRGSDQSRNLAKGYSWPLAAPVSTGYGNAMDDWGITGEGPATIGIRVRPTATRPNLMATIRSVKVKFAYDLGGKIDISGSAGVKVSDHHHEATGGVKIQGDAKVRLVEYTPPQPLLAEPVRAIAYVPPSPSKSFLIRALSVEPTTVTITPMPQDVVPVLEQLHSVVAKCNCFGMPLSIPFSHNLSGANKLGEFIQRNGLTLPKFTTLQYNKTNESWQANLRYSGLSAVAPSIEIWSIVFELQCTDFLGGTQIGQGVWRFGIRVNQRNQNTGQDFDSRVLMAFLPDPICSKGQEFRVKLTFDTLLGIAATNPQSTLYEVIIHDNIGLFKSSSWISSPRLLIDMSQAGLSQTPARLPYNLGV